MEPIKDKERYAATTSLLIHSEAITWTRFNTFLVMEAMLLAAYGIVYVNQPPYTVGICTLLCVVGAFFGKCWADFGDRGRAFVKAYTEMGKSLEVPSGPANETKPKEDPTEEEEAARAMQLGPHHLTVLVRDKPYPRWSDKPHPRWSPDSRSLLCFVPLVFLVVFSILFAISWWRYLGL